MASVPWQTCGFGGSVGGSKAWIWPGWWCASSVVGGKPNSYQRPSGRTKRECRCTLPIIPTPRKPQKAHNLQKKWRYCQLSPSSLPARAPSASPVRSLPTVHVFSPLLDRECLQQEPSLLHLQVQGQNAFRINAFIKNKQQCGIIPKQNVEINEIFATLPSLSPRIQFSLSVLILKYITTRMAPASTNQKRSKLAQKLSPGPHAVWD